MLLRSFSWSTCEATLPPRHSPCVRGLLSAMAVLVALMTLSTCAWMREKSTAWAPVAPFIPDRPIRGSGLALKPADPNGWTRSIDFPPAGPFIKNLTGVRIERLSYTVVASGNYPCQDYRDATLKYGMNGAAERFSEQDSHALGNAFARVQIGASWNLRGSKPADRSRLFFYHSCH